MNNGLKNLLNDSISIKPTLMNGSLVIFIYILLKNIFLKKNQKNQKFQNAVNKKLEEWIININKKIIINPKKYINREYNLDNLLNIINFIKKQNIKYCGDIAENIIIYIFSKIFKVTRDKELNSYISNNLNKIREQKNSEFIIWIKSEKFAPPELNNIESLLDIDGKEEVLEANDQKSKSIFYNFLREILKLKYIPLSDKIKSIYLKNNQYINLDKNFNFIISEFIYNSLKYNNKEHTILDKDIINNSQMNIINNLSHPISEQNVPVTRLIHCFFTQAFIYHQNKSSPLLKYTIPEKDLTAVPFVFDLRGACIEARFSYVIISPLRVGNLVSNIYLKQNNLRESGFYELGKLCTFNNVKIIEVDTCLIRSIYLDYMNEAMGVFINDSVEELNLSYNYLREDFVGPLIKILKHFKELKTINLSSNEIKRGLADIFIVLKKLYRQRKTKIETLILNKCILDETSFYELGELLKCKFCKLKTIYLNNNPIPATYNFLQRLKKNKSLENIYISKADIENGSTGDILKIISCSSIRSLYIFKNNLNNFNDLLKILFRTKIIKAGQIGYIVNEDTVLINLDISNNEYPIKNRFHIKLLKNILENTSIFCLDMCHILSGINPGTKKPEDEEFNHGVDEIQKYLEESKKNYENIIKEIRKNKETIEEFKYLENENFLGKKLFKNYTQDVYDNKDSDYPVYMKMLAKKIIEEEKKEDLAENRENVEKLAKYLMLKNSQYNLDQLETKETKKKLIII